jgi:hypothetical protein
MQGTTDEDGNTTFHSLKDTEQLANALQAFPSETLNQRNNKGLKPTRSPNRMTNWAGVSPLFLHCIERNIPLIKALLLAGADPNLPNAHDACALVR